MKEIAYEPLKLRLVGVAPFLMHNARLADPSDPIVQLMATITAKRKKTEDDRLLLSMLEWAGSLYCTELVKVDDRGNIISGGRPCITAELFEGMALAGARKIRAKAAFASGLMVDGDSILEHGGPKGLADLQAKPGYRDFRGVKMPRGGRIMRTRPIFRKWSVEVTFLFLPDVISSKKELFETIEMAGRIIGIGDYRPKFGRFMVEEIAA